MITGAICIDLVSLYPEQVDAFQKAMLAYYVHSKVAREHGYDYVDFSHKYNLVTDSMFTWPVKTSARDDKQYHVKERVEWTSFRGARRVSLDFVYLFFNSALKGLLSKI